MRNVSILRIRDNIQPEGGGVANAIKRGGPGQHEGRDLRMGRGEKGGTGTSDLDRGGTES